VSFWDRLAAVRTEWDVLEHPFYVRWSEGRLSREELAAYAGQYRHAVTALAEASRTAAGRADGPLRAHLEEHAAEEAEHVALWDGFVDAAGGDATAAPTPETADCATAWSGPDRPVLSTLAALYAIEAAQPAISATKASGLRERYGIDAAEATAYFDLHEHLDVEHAAAGRAFIAERLDGGDAETLVARAEDVLRANWELLDGIERTAR
jgi:pyrroloquinoline-quinone synthase